MPAKAKNQHAPGNARSPVDSVKQRSNDNLRSQTLSTRDVARRPKNSFELK